MSTTSSPQANPVTPSLCWDIPDGTVSACILAHLLYLLCFFDCHLWPTKVHHTLHHHCNQRCAVVYLCTAVRLPPPLKSPPMLSSPLLWCVTLALAWRQEMQSASGCSFTQKRRNDGVISHPPTTLAPLSFQEPVQNCSPWVCSWLPHGLWLSLLPLCFVCLSDTCLLSFKSLFFCNFLPSGIATWSTSVSA